MSVGQMLIWNALQWVENEKKLIELGYSYPVAWRESPYWCSRWSQEAVG